MDTNPTNPARLSYYVANINPAYIEGLLFSSTTILLHDEYKLSRHRVFSLQQHDYLITHRIQTPQASSAYSLVTWLSYYAANTNFTRTKCLLFSSTTILLRGRYKSCRHCVLTFQQHDYLIMPDHLSTMRLSYLTGMNLALQRVPKMSIMPSRKDFSYNEV